MVSTKYQLAFNICRPTENSRRKKFGSSEVLLQNRFGYRSKKCIDECGTTKVGK